MDTKHQGTTNYSPTSQGQTQLGSWKLLRSLVMCLGRIHGVYQVSNMVFCLGMVHFGLHPWKHTIFLNLAVRAFPMHLSSWYWHAFSIVECDLICLLRRLILRDYLLKAFMSSASWFEPGQDGWSWNTPCACSHTRTVVITNRTAHSTSFS